MTDQLPSGPWLEVVDRTPLVSIDLIVRDAQDRVLLGLRRNEPALGSWFVPGGVIRKNERLGNAFMRIASSELGLTLDYPSAKFMGYFEHFYPVNFAKVSGISTHYVVLAHSIRHDGDDAIPDAQHEKLRWWTPADLLASDAVHSYTKAYFH